MFPAQGKTTLAAAWSRATNIAANIKSTTQNLIAAASISRIAVLEYANQLATHLASLDTLAATPGLAVYAQNELNDPGIDIVAEFITMRAQIVSVQDWIIGNFPNDGSGNLIVFTFDVNKRTADISLTAPQLSAFKTQLTALAATIN